MLEPLASINLVLVAANVKRAISIALLGLAVCLATAQSGPKPHQRITVGVNSDYPPYEFKDSLGHPSGFDVDIVRAAAGAVFIDSDIQAGPWSDLRAKVEAHRLDLLAGMLYSEERAKLVDFGDPYHNVDYAIFVRKDGPQITDLRDVKGEAVLVEKGSQMHDLAKQMGIRNIVPVASEPEAIRSLADGQGDVALAPLLEGLSVKESEGFDSIQSIGASLLSRELRFATGKGNTALISRLNTGLAIIKGDGTYDRIYRKWFSGVTPEPNVWERYKTWIFATFFLLAATALGTLLWVSTLRRLVEDRTRAFKAELAERIRTEEDLRVSEAKYRTLVEKAGDGIFVANDDYLITDANATGCAMLGYDREQLIGKRVEELFADEDLQSRPIDWEKLMSGEVVTNERIGVRSDGTHFPVESSARRVGPNLFQGIVRDITTRKEIASQLQKLNEDLEHRVAERTHDLEQANLELESFSYSVAHDLRAPLRAMDGYATILIRENSHELSEDAQELLNRISVNARRMGLLIDDLLSYARMSRTPLDSKPLDMTKIAREAMEQLREVHREWSGLADIANLPPSFGDATLVKLVFHNLLENGIKFSAHSPSPKIEIGFDSNRAMYFVRDNGVGFEQAYADKLFKVFERLHTEAAFEGTGVGLATVKRIVERHGGTVLAESKVGQGATFFFSLPPAPNPA
jgi:PAS domain S-box-containing protein